MGIIRMILALTITLGHIYSILGFRRYELVSSPIAFQSFFLVSGFYISLVLNEKYLPKKGSYRLFISNRLIRIFPVYWLALGLTVAVCLICWYVYGDALILQQTIDYWGKLDPGVFLYTTFANLAILSQELIFFLKINPETLGLMFTGEFLVSEPQVHHFILISQVWAVSYILLFYLMAPFLVRKKVWVLLALLGLSLGLRVWAYSLGYSHEPWRYRFFPFEFAMFMAGALSYRIYAATKQIRIPPWVLWTVFILFTSLTLGYDLIHSDYRTKQIIYYVLLVVLMPFIFRLTKNFKWDRWIAEISFPVFLLHFLFVHLLSFLFDLSPLGITVLVLATTVAVSVMVKMWFMDPLEAYRQKRTRARL